MVQSFVSSDVAFQGLCIRQ